MSREPWEADHELDVAGAQARLRETFPELPARDVRYFAEGWDFRMFEVDGEWLFRFPKREKEATRLAREVALLARLDGRLPVAIPRYEFTAPGLAGYRKLTGAEPTGAATPSFATTLAAALSALHAVEPADLEMPGTDDVGCPEDMRRSLRHELAKARGKLDRTLHAHCVALMECEPPAAYDGPRRLIHNDLYPENMLLGPDGGVAGLVDWADAALSDPAGDFNVAAFRGGEPCLHATLERYTGEIDDAMFARARYYGVGMAVGHITTGARMDKDKYTRAGLEALTRLAPLPRRPRRG